MGFSPKKAIERQLSASHVSNINDSKHEREASTRPLLVLLLREERPLVPPKRERVAELPATPGGGATITR